MSLTSRPRENSFTPGKIVPSWKTSTVSVLNRVGAVRFLAADVQPVGLDRGVADALAVTQEDGHDHGHVLRVRAGAVGDVVEDDVARLERLLPAHGLHRGGYAEAHRAHERGQRRRLGEHRRMAVVERGGEV